MSICLEELHSSLLGSTKASHCLVFIHGMGCRQQDWRMQISYFSERYCILTGDLPGHGGALPADANQSWDIVSFAKAVKQWTEQLGDKQKLVLIGHSAAVRIVLELYCQLTSRISGLVFIDCGYQALPHPSLKGIQQLVASQGYDAWLQSFFATKFGDYTPHVLRDELLQTIRKVDKQGLIEFLYELKLYDYYASEKCLRLVTIPILVLQSSFYLQNNRQTPGENHSDWLLLVRRTLPQADIEIFPDCGHWIMLEQPALCNQLISNFLLKFC